MVSGVFMRGSVENDVPIFRISWFFEPGHDIGANAGFDVGLAAVAAPPLFSPLRRNHGKFLKIMLVSVRAERDAVAYCGFKSPADLPNASTAGEAAIARRRA